MIERFLLLSGGYFPEALRKTVLFHAKESMEQARRDGAHADPYHRERVALVSGLCTLHEVPFRAHLF